MFEEWIYLAHDMAYLLACWRTVLNMLVSYIRKCVEWLSDR
jgi:hypothetical protein